MLPPVSKQGLSLLALALTASVLSGCGDGPGIAATNQKPQVAIDRPTDGEQFKPGPLYIEVQASDQDNNENPEDLTIELKYSGGSGGAQLLNCEGGATKPNASGLFSCTTTFSFENGSYSLTARAKDTRDAWSDTQTVSFSVQNDAPVCAFRTPESGSTAQFDEELPTTLILDCQDPDGEIAQGEVCVNSDLNGILGCVNPSSNGTASVQATFTIPGTHIVTATVTDADGGSGEDSFTAVVRPCEDQDGDGISICETLSDPVDCDDTNPDAYPDNEEICDGFDNDCDGLIDNIPDTDGDGYLCSDCDNETLAINPGAVERCNATDDDCDGDIDEDFDLDGDGYFYACASEDKGIDCDDSNPAVHPDTLEACDGVDTNCNGTIDDKDTDKDGYVDGTCTGYIGEDGGDCDDNNGFYNPGVTEICDGTDEDCDGLIDDNTECYDDDGDGYCESGCGDGSIEGDCDDTFAHTYPGAVERFDHRDNNCDDVVEGSVLPIDLAWLQFDGHLPNEEMGFSLSGGGDMNGDGIGDLVLGAPGYDTTQSDQRNGAAVVIHGRTDWTVGEPLDTQSLSGAYVFAESRDGAEAGYSVSLVGDMDNNGLADFAVGAPGADLTVGLQTLSDAGSAYLFLGKTAGWGNASLITADTRVDGTFAGVEMGTSLSGGDVNGDNLADLIIGAPHPTEGPTGAAGWGFIFTGRFSGFPGTALPSAVFQLKGGSGETLGRQVAFAGLTDGDGLSDFLIAGDGDTSDRGIVYRISGSTALVQGNSGDSVDLETAAISGEFSSEEVGSSLSGGWDLNGDTRADYLVGRTYVDTSVNLGMAHMFFGDNSGVQLDGYADDLASVVFVPQADDHCPCSVATIGDMNGDGIGDFALSAAYADVDGLQGAGRVYLFYGRDGVDATWPAEVDVALEADAIFYGTSLQQRLGFSLAGLGDINGDGWDDLGIGAPFTTTSPDGINDVERAGQVFVQFGAPTP